MGAPSARQFSERAGTPLKADLSQLVRQVVLLPFPFSDLSNQKLRPALVLADAGRDDWVLCQITSKSYADSRAVELLNTAFAQGGLQLASYARPAKLFTPHASLIRSVAGVLNDPAHQRVLDAVLSWLREGAARS